MSKNEAARYYPKSRSDWRNWLENNHHSEHSVWVVFYKVTSKIPSLTWSEAVDEALCFGWIDSTKKTIDGASYMQYYSKRKPKSNWSRINKDKVTKLIQNGLMTKAGLESINVAKENGSWTILHDVENLVVPKDLMDALNKQENAMTYFERQSNSVKKMMLYWVISAKRSETRTKRILEIASCAALGVKPKHFG